MFITVDGATLNIEAGTVIKSAAGTGTDATALIISRTGKINAIGFPSAPIIFAAEADPMDGSWGPENGNAWGGLIILGNAPLNSDRNKESWAEGATIEDTVEGIPEFLPESSRKFGGTDPADSSGVLSYVSIRFGGSALAQDAEINGLTLGGVGSGTQIDHIEVFGNSDDSIEFFGGMVDLKYAVSAYGGDDGFDYDQGWEGRGQFWVYIGGPIANNAHVPNNGGEHDGETSTNPGRNIGGGTVYNATYVGNGQKGHALRIRDNAYAVYKNSIFTGWPEGIRIEPDSGLRIPGNGQTEKLIDISNNIWDFDTAVLFDGDEDDTLGAGGSNLDDDESFLAEAGLNNTVEAAGLTGISREADGGFDPRPTSSSPALTNTLADLPDGDTWFTPVSYQGAFNTTDNWMAGWTYLSEAGYLPASASEPSDTGDLANISGRTSVAAGASTITGFTVLGTKTVLIRAVGPKLADLGVASPMPDPTMTLFQTNFSTGGSDEVATVANWDSGGAESAAKVIAAADFAGLFPFLATDDFQGQNLPTVDTTSTAAVLTLTEGLYTIVVTDEGGVAGEVLIDVTVID
ncbi:MAG: hypothetical protein VYC82_10080 [Verrucomicrobiota bacterium]|nr:hypothetical protein [Verrucomicrobiota bacterium]